MSGLDQLILCLQWLAAEPEKALAVSSVPATIPDEIANDLDTFLDVATRAGDLRGEQLLLISEIERVLDAWSGQDHADFWTPEAFAKSPIWADLRDRARYVLVAMDAPRQDDDLLGRV